MARYAIYETLTEIIRHRFSEPKATPKQLYSRVVFNVICGNTDDHARNHAAFWNGHSLSLTPAHDICPRGRTGNEATQAMLTVGGNRMSRISTCIEAAQNFLLLKAEAYHIADHQQ